jgi:RHS repeat-associated protein
VDEILASENAAGTILWGLADREGTIRDIVNNSTKTVTYHRTFDSYGNVKEYDASNNLVTNGPLAADFVFGYTGQAYDSATSLYDYWHRWYDPSVGRFASEDPAAADSNLYRYCGNNPINTIDPTGLCGVKTTADACSDAAVGAQRRVRDSLVEQLPNYIASLLGQGVQVAMATHQARADRDSAWFFPEEAGDRILQGMKAAFQLDQEMERVRRFLILNDDVADRILGNEYLTRYVENDNPRNALNSSDSFLRLAVALQKSTNYDIIHSYDGIQPSWSPLDLLAGVATGAIMAPVATASSTASGSLQASSQFVRAESPALSQTFAGAGISDTGAMTFNSLLSSNVATTVTTQSLGGLTRSIATNAPVISSGVAGNVLANITASQLARQTGSGFAQHLGTEMVYRNAAAAYSSAKATGLTNQFGRLGTYAHQEFASLNTAANEVLKRNGVELVAEEYRNVVGAVVDPRSLGSRSIDVYIKVNGQAVRGLDLKTGAAWSTNTVKVIQSRFQVPVSQIRYP